MGKLIVGVILIVLAVLILHSIVHANTPLDREDYDKAQEEFLKNIKK